MTKEDIQHITRFPTLIKGFGTDFLTCRQMDSTFNADAQFSIKFLCTEEGVRMLMEADFEVVDDVQTLLGRRPLGPATADTRTYKHLMVCSLRLQDFLIGPDLLQTQLFIFGGEVSVLQKQSVTSDYDTRIGDQADDGHEREVTVTMKAAEITMSFGFIFEGTPETANWASGASKSRQVVQDMGAKRNNTTDVQDLGFEDFIE